MTLLEGDIMDVDIKDIGEVGVCTAGYGGDGKADSMEEQDDEDESVSERDGDSDKNVDAEEEREQDNNEEEEEDMDVDNVLDNEVNTKSTLKPKKRR